MEKNERMTKTIHCVRHAQGLHNLTTDNHHLIDPDLTALGEQQCLSLATTFDRHHAVDLIIASPLRRTLRTALLAFSQPLQRLGRPVIALPHIQETTGLPCDTGSELGAISGDFDGLPIDWSQVEIGWQVKVSH
jgi:hypothetical protein